MFWRFVGGRRKAIDLDNLFQGSCFLIGGNPELMQHRELLEDGDIVTMAMNNAGTFIKPTLWTGADEPNYYSSSILLNPSIMKFMYVTRADKMVKDTGIQARTVPNIYFTTGLPDFPDRGFFLRQRDCGWWKNVFMITLQILHRLGFSKVYACGCKFQIEKDQPYNFDRKLSDQQVEYNRNTYNCVLRQLKGILPYAQEAHFELISCTPDSALNELVPYMDIKEAVRREDDKVPANNTADCRHPVPDLKLVPKAELPKTTILIPTGPDRADLLEHGLTSICRQTTEAPGRYEIIVLDETDGKDLVLTEQGNVKLIERIAKRHGARYVHTGANVKQWRIPGFAFNIGAKMATGEILVLTCPEIWHIDDCLDKMVSACAANPKNVVVPVMYDDDKRFLEALGERYSGTMMESLKDMKKLRPELPWLMALHKSHYMEIGGYDEDFTGRAFDDDDFIGRLVDNGCELLKLSLRAIHLYHPRQTVAVTGDGDRVAHNKKLYEQRKGTVKRNVGRSWGVFDA